MFDLNQFTHFDIDGVIYKEGINAVNLGDELTLISDSVFGHRKGDKCVLTLFTNKENEINTLLSKYNAGDMQRCYLYQGEVMFPCGKKYLYSRAIHKALKLTK